MNLRFVCEKSDTTFLRLDDTTFGTGTFDPLCQPRCVEVSEIVTDIFKAVSGKSLPINVDGVIGAIVADMGLNIDLAKALFVYGRVAGLSAHYFEEISTQRPMRRIDFGAAIYEGQADRKYPA